MRSSFHQAVVARPGMRRSTSRASASAARRTSVKLQRGSMRTLTWMPREPLVLGKPSIPCSRRTSPAHSATSRTSLHSTPGCGSRSMRSSSGWSRSLRRTGHGFQSMLPRLTPQIEVGGVVGHELGGAATRREVHGRGLQPLGALLGHALLEEDLAGDPVPPALEHRRAVVEPADGRLGGLQVVVDEVELGEVRARESRPCSGLETRSSLATDLDRRVLLRGSHG